MPLNRCASHSTQLVALFALALACVRCSSDNVDSGANTKAGSSGTAGTPGVGGSAAHAGAEPTSGTGNDHEGGAAGEDTGAQAGTGTEAAGQAGAGEQPVDIIPDYNGCVSGDYEDQSAPEALRVIAIATQGLNFTPRCLTIAAGQTVRFEGSLSAHPLAPGNPDQADAGSADNPIQKTGSGTSVEFTFPTSGTFPYYCELHSFGNGQGMAGVVHVKP